MSSTKGKLTLQKNATGKEPILKRTKAFDNKIEAKKAAVLKAGKRRGLTNLVMLALGLVIVACGIYFYTSLKKPGSALDPALSSAPAGDQVTYAATLFHDGKARHYEFRNGNFTVKYFIVKSSDGVIRAAFDACDVCWPAGKGYLQQGDHMVCRNCGRRFASALVNEVQGGCNPAPLTRTIQNDKVVIKMKDILEGKQYFNFSGKV